MTSGQILSAKECRLMKWTVLGSAAAEAIPNPFCRCEVCQHARRVGGPEIRARSAALVNDDLLVDLGPDLFGAANRLGLYLGNLQAVLITHGHLDHWLPSNLAWRAPSYTSTPLPPLTVYGPGDALSALQPYADQETALSCTTVRAGDRWRAGPYEIVALPATHGKGLLESLLYVISDGTHRAFYATDTATLSEAAWEVLRPWAPLDLIMLDETMGLRSGSSGHHGFECFVETRARLIGEGLLGPEGRLIAHHFSHNGGLTHAELVRKFRPYQVTVAYDGLIVTL
jgi:phosphoribosyl 1,2-cyclic phosphate phosphodiesterase